MPTNEYIRKSLLYFLFISILTLFITQTVKAAETGTVTATVTAQSISVTITTDGAVAFTTINVDSTKDTTTAGVDDSETAENNGNVTEDFNIKSEDSSSSGAGWTLGGTAGSETFTMKSCIATCDATPTWASVGVDPSYVQLAAGITASGTQIFDLQVGTPVTTTDYNEQTIIVTIQAVIGA